MDQLDYISNFIPKKYQDQLDELHIQEINLIYQLFKSEKFDPNNNYPGIINKYIGLYFMKTNSENNMVNYFQKSIDLGCIQLYLILGLYFHDRANYPKSEQYYKLAVKNKIPKSVEYLGILYDELEKYEEAINLYQENPIEYANELGEVYFKINEVTKSLDAYLVGFKNGNLDSLNNILIILNYLSKNNPTNFKELVPKYLIRENLQEFIKNQNIIKNQQVINMLNKNQ